ncbi:MAG: DUF3108 domain-containing protein [Planctomycetes bacterium]|nr:DUF3108 domain-containing protein [Planctomycetota bacterium]
MFTRATGYVIVPMWISAMGWLVAHDVWPGFTADDTPVLQATDWLKTEGLQAQFAIHNDMGRLGTIWTAYLIQDTSIRRLDTIWVEQFPLDIAPLRMTVDSIFTVDGNLDELTVRLENSSADILLHGERFHKDFSFVFQNGLSEKPFKVPLFDGKLISGGAFNPFAALTDLHVGQRWRMQVLNPVALLTGLGDRFIPMLVEVSGKETVTAAGRDVECVVVESASAKAWVDANGAVQVQEMVLPLVGRIRIVREDSFNEGARRTAKEGRLYGRRGGQP